MDIAHLFRAALMPARGRRPWLLGLLAGAALLVGCSPTRLLDAVTPKGNYRLDADRTYGDHPRQRLDVYRPAEGDSGIVIVFFYGGNWRTGSKSGYRFIAESLTRRGITVVVPDYRVYPEVSFPGFVEDGARALRWVHDNLARTGTRVFVMGHSSGAHIAALLALDPRYRMAAGLREDSIAGLVGISGPYDFLPFSSQRTAEVFTGTADLTRTQPITFAGPNSPPTLLFHGAQDRTVFTHNAENLSAALRRSGIPVRYVLYQDRGHVDIMLGLSSALDSDGRLMGDLSAFLAVPRQAGEAAPSTGNRTLTSAPGPLP